VKWFGTTSGLACFDGINWKVYNKDNSPLPSSMIRALTIDINGHVWIGTDKGLAKFNGVDWSVYTSMNSIISNDAITTIVCDQTSGYLWIGTEKGLVKYDGENWVRFDDTNSGLISDFICSIAIGQAGITWVGTFDHFQFAGRLFRFDGSDWLVTRLEQKGLNSSFPQALIIDQENKLWMGVKGTMGGALVSIQGSNWQVFNNQTSNHINGGINSLLSQGNCKWMGGVGLISFSGTDFKKFDISNSPLPDNFVYTLAIDSKGTKWIGTIYGGIAAYNESGIKAHDSAHHLLRIYPNPVISSTNILYNMPQKQHVTVSIYNSIGVLVQILQDKVAEKGDHSIPWKPSQLTKGVYLCTIKRGKKTLTKKLLLK
jgi:ligand-binding sensor domain-containing protein